MKFVVPILLLFARTGVSSDHPGNVFVIGDRVAVAIPATWVGWRAIDIDGKVLGQGAAGQATTDLGQLPVGYFEVRQVAGPGRISAAVVAKTTPVDNTPIAIDAAMSWFYSDSQQLHDACALCRLAGVKWVRDRASWPEIEPARDTWAGETRYEKAMRLQHDEGLKILQVNHISPPWAAKDPKHFPDDLRDVYNFYLGLAKRWKGLADAIEPWNEPDIDMFGGHTGSEIASFQKAAYLGSKAGDPSLPVCEAVFAIARENTLDEFGENEVYPYFDRYDLHHYTALPTYPGVYAKHRAVSGGRPMWTTEFNLTINWSDEKTKEPSEQDLRVQAYRVSKVFAEALHEGVEKAFYFMLGHYVERYLQYGLVHIDLTPRPAYVAFAAVGRLLSAAKPIGRVNFGDDKLKGYCFKTQVDGRQRETMVAWSETEQTAVKVSAVDSAYDYLGRKLLNQKEFELTRAPIFIVFRQSGTQQFKIDAPPAKAKWRDRKACPVVLQLIGKGDVNKSAFLLDKRNQLRLAAYNFGPEPIRGTLKIEEATVSLKELTIPPGGREEQTIGATGKGAITARLDLGDLGTAIVYGQVATNTKDTK